MFGVVCHLILGNVRVNAEVVIKNKCISVFDRCYDKEKALIEWIKANRIKVLNSGIK